MKKRRIFLIVLDSFGIGEMPDSAHYGDKGSNTLHSCFLQKELSIPNMKKMGLFNIDGIDFGEKEENPATGAASFVPAIVALAVVAGFMASKRK